MGVFDSAAQLNSSSAQLDGPPPAPPAIPARPGLLNLAGGPGVSGSPQQMAVTGLALMEQGSKLLATVLPGLSPIVAETLANLRATVPRALSELTQGGSSLPAGADSMMPYAPGMAQGGGGGMGGANAGMRPPGMM